jgi:hypothetical protein
MVLRPEAERGYRFQPGFRVCLASFSKPASRRAGGIGVRASLRMDERDWRIPIEPRSKSKVTSLPLRYANAAIPPTRGLGHDAKHIQGFNLGSNLVPTWWATPAAD